MHKSTLNILETEAVKQNDNLMDSLNKRLAKLDKSMKTFRSYQQVILPLKQGKMSIAIPEMLRNPLFFRFVRLEILRRLNNQRSKLKAKLGNSNQFSAGTN